MVRILSTKKLQPNQKQYLLNAGLNVIEADFITIRLNKFLTSTICQNLIFTSTNAFKSFLANLEAEKYTDRNIFCVGSKTKQVIEENGFTVAECEDYAEGLADIITKKYSDQEFTFFCGNLRRDTLPDAMKKAGITFNEIEVYQTALASHKINSRINGILFFSPSGVESFLKKNTINDEVCFCIGTTTAAALQGITQNVVVANKPTAENVIVQCINYYKNQDPVSF